MEFDSETGTSTVAAKILTSAGNVLKVSQVSVKIRAKGTATFFAIGGGDRQEYRLTAAGESIQIIARNPRKWFDLRDLYGKADTADLTYDLFWENYVPPC